MARRKIHKQKKKIHTVIWIIPVILSTIMLGLGVYTCNRLQTADNLYKEGNFSQSIKAYKSLRLPFNIDQSEINDTIAQALIEERHARLLHEGEVLLHNKQYLPAISYLFQIPQTSRYYEQGQKDMLAASYANTDAIHKPLVDTIVSSASNATDSFSLNSNLTRADGAIFQTTPTPRAPISRNEITPTPTTTPTEPVTYALNVPILMYHYIRINPDPTDAVGFSLSVTPTDFASQMEYLATHNYHTITIVQLVQSLQTGTPLPSHPIILTFDDGYDDFYTVAYPILQHYQLKAETYVITGFVGQPRYMSWGMLKMLAKDPLITIGSHTLHHLDLTTLSLSSIESELMQSKQTLEQQLGINITDFCYPSGKVNSLVMAEVHKAGYLDATTTQTGSEHTQDSALLLNRIRISGGETLQTYITSL